MCFAVATSSSGDSNRAHSAGLLDPLKFPLYLSLTEGGMVGGEREIPDLVNVGFVDGHSKAIKYIQFMDQHPQAAGGGWSGYKLRLNQDPTAADPNI
jgi:prepilin-type processing-associated H-X9-DG protein